MKPAEPITILGGGLSGLTLGLLLREQGIPVSVIEAGQYPRHRVCGEFLSGHGQAVLSQLGLLPACFAAGARMAQTARFASDTRSSPVRPLPRPALCLSRHTLDSLLATELIRRGGEVRTGERGDIAADHPGWVQATGRRPSAQVGGWRWFGVKAHADNVTLSADLELHVSANAYVGLCRLAQHRVNVCGLFRRPVRGRETATSDRQPLDWLRGRPGSPRFERLAQAHFVPESLCTVAGLDLRPRRATGQVRFALGDALSMIPPFTGNGMSLALETAHWAAAPLAAYARGASGWDEARAAYGRHFDQHCQQRLRWAGWLQRLLFMPLAPSLLLGLSRNNFAWRRLFDLTRSG